MRQMVIKSGILVALLVIGLAHSAAVFAQGPRPDVVEGPVTTDHQIGRFVINSAGLDGDQVAGGAQQYKAYVSVGQHLASAKKNEQARFSFVGFWWLTGAIDESTTVFLPLLLK